MASVGISHEDCMGPHQQHKSIKKIGALHLRQLAREEFSAEARLVAEHPIFSPLRYEIGDDGMR